MRVHRDVCGEISEHGAPMSQWHDPVHAGRNKPPQFATYHPSSNRSGRMSHLESATRRTCREDHREGPSEEKENKPRPEKSTIQMQEQSF